MPNVARKRIYKKKEPLRHNCCNPLCKRFANYRMLTCRGCHAALPLVWMVWLNVASLSPQEKSLWRQAIAQFFTNILSKENL